MDIINYNQFLPRDDSVNVNDLCCKWPFRLSVIGPSACGKTNMVVDMVLNHIYYDDLYVLAKDLEEPLYMFLEQKMKLVNELLISQGQQEKGIHFSNQLDMDIDALDKDRQSLIIIDDFITAKDQKLAEDLFIRGRKKNASTIYISQSYFQIPKMIRLNSSYFALFNVPNKKQLRAIADTHSTRIDFRRFMKYYKEIHSDPYKFMLIDNVETRPELHIRNCWDGALIDDLSSDD